MGKSETDSESRSSRRSLCWDFDFTLKVELSVEVEGGAAVWNDEREDSEMRRDGIVSQDPRDFKFFSLEK